MVAFNEVACNFRVLALPPPPPLFPADSSDDWLVIQQTALEWIHQFILLSQNQMLPYASGILCAILPCFAYATDARKEARSLAQHANSELLRLVTAENQEEEEKDGVKLAQGDGLEKR